LRARASRTLHGSASAAWGPFLTQNLDVDAPAKVVYFRTAGSRTIDKRLAFRTLEDANLANETIVRLTDSNAGFWGHWVRIDSKDYIVSTYGPASGTADVDVVLYDPTDPTLTPINLTADRQGRRSDAWIDFDPAAPLGGRYTLVSVRTDHSVAPSRTLIEVYQRTTPTEWTFQYEFDAVIADENDPDNVHVQSPELFRYGNQLYIAFVSSNAPDFVTASKGNVRITRIEADDTTPGDNHYRRLNVSTLAKRTEPEIHYLGTELPVVFYTQEAPVGDVSCPLYPVAVNKLMRARTGYLWQD
jgi:hypothetical protein